MRNVRRNTFLFCQMLLSMLGTLFPFFALSSIHDFTGSFVVTVVLGELRLFASTSFPKSFQRSRGLISRFLLLPSHFGWKQIDLKFPIFMSWFQGKKSTVRVKYQYTVVGQSVFGLQNAIFFGEIFEWEGESRFLKLH